MDRVSKEKSGDGKKSPERINVKRSEPPDWELVSCHSLSQTGVEFLDLGLESGSDSLVTLSLSQPWKPRCTQRNSVQTGKCGRNRGSRRKRLWQRRTRQVWRLYRADGPSHVSTLTHGFKFSREPAATGFPDVRGLAGRATGSWKLPPTKGGGKRNVPIEYFLSSSVKLWFLVADEFKYYNTHQPLLQ